MTHISLPLVAVVLAVSAFHHAVPVQANDPFALIVDTVSGVAKAKSDMAQAGADLVRQAGDFAVDMTTSATDIAKSKVDAVNTGIEAVTSGIGSFGIFQQESRTPASLFETTDNIGDDDDKDNAEDLKKNRKQARQEEQEAERKRIDERKRNQNKNDAKKENAKKYSKNDAKNASGSRLMKERRGVSRQQNSKQRVRNVNRISSEMEFVLGRRMLVALDKKMI